MGESVDLGGRRIIRSEEHTSELQSHDNLVCRLLLEKKKHKLAPLVAEAPLVRLARASDRAPHGAAVKRQAARAAVALLERDARELLLFFLKMRAPPELPPFPHPAPLPA